VARHSLEFLTPDPRICDGERGFTLATLVVLMAVMAVFLTVAIESVSFQQRREKEQELIFRGTQIVEGIRLFRARFGRFPVKLEELPNAKPRVLRKAWADPMTGKPDWQPVFLGQEGTTLQPTPNRVQPPADSASDRRPGRNRHDRRGEIPRLRKLDQGVSGAHQLLRLEVLL